MTPPFAASFDAIIIGGGYAGLCAARDLRDAGRTVLLLEGRDRLGGRTWSRPFRSPEAAQHQVELGGNWVAPQYQPFIAREMHRYGIGLDQRYRGHEPFTWRFGGTAGRGFPLSGDEIYELERAWYRIMEASRRVDPSAPRDLQDLADLDISVEAFLRGLDLGERAYEFLSAFGTLGSGAASSDWSAVTAFSLIAAFGGSVYAWYAAVQDKLDGGTGTIVQALAEDGGATIRLSAAVSAVSQEDDEVVVATETGDRYRAGVAVVAIPVNVWGDVIFEPQLSEAKRSLARYGHANRMRKVWILVEGVAPGVHGFGAGNELLTLSTHYRIGDRSLMVGFAAPPSELDVGDREAVEFGVRQYFPEARVVAIDAHDWNSDRFSKGGWLTYRPGQATRYMSQLQRPEGRLYFAGADIAMRWIGWLDGALESGSSAAAGALARLEADETHDRARRPVA